MDSFHACGAECQALNGRPCRTVIPPKPKASLQIYDVKITHKGTESALQVQAESREMAHFLAGTQWMMERVRSMAVDYGAYSNAYNIPFAGDPIIVDITEA